MLNVINEREVWAGKLQKFIVIRSLVAHSLPSWGFGFGRGG